MIRIILFMILGAVIGYAAYFLTRKLRSKPAPYTIYKDFILAIRFMDDNVNNVHVIFCLIRSESGDEMQVLCPSLNDQEFTVVWVPRKNNYFFKDQLHLIS